jgi:hypothetical protein
MLLSVRISKNDFDGGIGILRYIHSLIGLSGCMISNEDIDTHFGHVFSSDNKLTVAGSDLIKLRHGAFHLMTNLYHKFSSTQAINKYGQQESAMNSNGDDSMKNDFFYYKESQGSGDNKSDDAAVLQSTNGLLCPGDLVVYCQQENRSNTKSSTIVRLLDPSTPDKKEVTLANRDILRPYIHEVRRVKMYGGGACGLLTDPLSTWMKLENCTFFVGCTSTFSESYVEDTNSSNKDNCCFSEGMCQ